MTPGQVIEANGLRYRIEAADDRWVIYRVWLGSVWSDERAIVVGAWREMVGGGQ